MKELEEAKLKEEFKNSAWIEATGQDDQFAQIDKQKIRNERHQAILRQSFAEDARKQGIQVDDVESVKAEHEGGEDPYKDTVDNLPVKRKQKWRLW